MRVSRDLAMNLLQARFHQSVHEASEKGPAWPDGLRAASGFCSGNACNTISDSNHRTSPSNRSIGKTLESVPTVALQDNRNGAADHSQGCMDAQ
jgi:hypothetical protein